MRDKLDIGLLEISLENASKYIKSYQEYSEKIEVTLKQQDDMIIRQKAEIIELKMDAENIAKRYEKDLEKLKLGLAEFVTKYMRESLIRADAESILTSARETSRIAIIKRIDDHFKYHFLNEKKGGKS